MSISILLIGIGGYGATYVNPLLDGVRPDAVIVGCVDPFPDSCARIGEIRERNIPVYPTMSAFFADGHTADLAVISSPIHLHTAQIKEALAYGCHVLCEKPLCGDVRDIPSLIEARDKAGKYVGIGYQVSYNSAILAMKQDVLDGVWGKPRFLRSLELEPRSFAYYKRGCGWAGKLKTEDGALILDSVANNAMAHYLHCMLFTLGETIDTSADPVEIRSSLWRAYPIENYDTCTIDMTFPGGVRGLYMVSHATDGTIGPLFDYEFENGHIYREKTPEGVILRGVFRDGTEKIYGNPVADQVKKLWDACDAVLDPTKKPVCGLEAASAHTKVIARIQEGGVRTFPEDRIHLREDGKAVYVDGLFEQLCDSYRSGSMWYQLK